MRSKLYLAVVDKTNASECGIDIRSDEYVRYTNSISLSGIFICVFSQIDIDIDDWKE